MHLHLTPSLPVQDLYGHGVKGKVHDCTSNRLSLSILNSYFYRNCHRYRARSKFKVHFYMFFYIQLSRSKVTTIFDHDVAHLDPQHLQVTEIWSGQSSKSIFRIIHMFEKSQRLQYTWVWPWCCKTIPRQIVRSICVKSELLPVCGYRDLPHTNWHKPTPINLARRLGWRQYQLWIAVR